MEADERELLELRRNVARFKTEARKNGDAWRRSRDSEIQLLEAETLSALLSRLTTGLRDAHQLHVATLAVADPLHEVRHLLLDQGAQARQFPAVCFVDDVLPLAPRILERGRPWLGPFEEAEHGRLFWGGSVPRSVAILPLLRQRGIVASLNLGSVDGLRFTHRHGTEFLAHLAVIAAYCLDNTVNRGKLTRSGLTDALTGWHNRRYLETRLQEEIARSRRERTSLVCLMIDIDHFKRINDDHGHLVGDEVLRQFAQCAGREVRASDLAARYGGEEFLLLLPGTEVDAGLALAERIRAAVSQRTFAVSRLDRPLHLTVSIGIAAYRPDTHDSDVKLTGEQLVAAADLALYDAKAGGRDRVALAANGR